MSTAFTPRGKLERTPLLRPAPAPSQSGWLRFGDERRTAVYLAAGVAGTLRAWAGEAQPRETMGLLAGRACEEATGPYTLVVGAVEAKSAETGRAHVFTDTARMAELVEHLRERFPIAEVVGWWHTHPGYGTRFSGVDEATQATFTAGSSVGLVVDPTRAHPEGMGVYLGPTSRRLSLVGALEEHATPAGALGCLGAQRRVLAPPHTEPAPEEAEP